MRESIEKKPSEPVLYGFWFSNGVFLTPMNENMENPRSSVKHKSKLKNESEKGILLKSQR
jgi:hypothetical protein